MAITRLEPRPCVAEPPPHHSALSRQGLPSRRCGPFHLAHLHYCRIFDCAAGHLHQICLRPNSNTRPCIGTLLALATRATNCFLIGLWPALALSLRSCTHIPSGRTSRPCELRRRAYANCCFRFELHRVVPFAVLRPVGSASASCQVALVRPRRPALPCAPVRPCASDTLSPWAAPLLLPVQARPRRLASGPLLSTWASVRLIFGMSNCLHQPCLSRLCRHAGLLLRPSSPLTRQCRTSRQAAAASLHF